MLRALRESGGTAVAIIDPAPAVARQVKRVLEKSAMLSANAAPPKIDLITTGDGGNFKQQVQHLLGYEHGVKTAVWHSENGELALQFSQVDL